MQTKDNVIDAKRFRHLAEAPINSTILFTREIQHR
jgi:hypothetical protein